MSWLLVSEPGFVLCFVRFREDFDFEVGISVHKQYSLLDTIFSYRFDFGPPGKYLYSGVMKKRGLLPRGL